MTMHEGIKKVTLPEVFVTVARSGFWLQDAQATDKTGAPVDPHVVVREDRDDRDSRKIEQ